MSERDDDGVDKDNVVVVATDDQASTLEDEFKNTEVPPWQKQIIVRPIVVSFFLSFVFTIIVCKLSLTTGVIPSLNVAAGLLGYASLKGYTTAFTKFGLLKQPFTRQENTVIQTCVVAAAGIAFSSGTGSYLLGMSSTVFIAIAMILGDGLFHVAYMIIVTTHSFIAKKKEASSVVQSSLETQIEKYDEQIKKEYFLKDQIPNSAAICGYIALAAISIGVMPVIFHQLKWYHVLVAYLVAPILAFCNAYGCGLTDWSLASNYGKIAILVFSSWVGLEKGGVLAGLASCGVILSIVSTASDLMQDFKTGYLTSASPRSMFFSQVIGTAMGCIMSPTVFWIFYKAYRVGDPDSSYPAPYGMMYRGIALLGVEGFSSLPKNCVKPSIGFFIGAILINVLVEVLKKYETKYRIYRFIPSPMCMAIPFYMLDYYCPTLVPCFSYHVLLAYK